MESSKVGFIERFASAATIWTGTNGAFVMAIAVIGVWAATGPVFRYSDTWQLVIRRGRHRRQLGPEHAECPC